MRTTTPNCMKCLLENLSSQDSPAIILDNFRSAVTRMLVVPYPAAFVGMHDTHSRSDLGIRNRRKAERCLAYLMRNIDFDATESVVSDDPGGIDGWSVSEPPGGGR